MNYTVNSRAMDEFENADKSKKKEKAHPNNIGLMDHWCPANHKSIQMVHHQMFFPKNNETNF